MGRHDNYEHEENKKLIFGVSISTIVLSLVAIGLLWGCPHYNVWQQGLAGEAEYRRAEQNRQVEVRKAEAKRDAASLLAQAEVARAKGVAEANKIIGDSLKENEAYLRYLWITNMSEAGKETIYIPTEAGIPILEAGKRVMPK